MTAPEQNNEAQILADRAQRYAMLRAHQTDPDVIAYQVHATLGFIERAMWAGIVIGMVFTTISIHAWTAAGAAPHSLEWWSYFLLALLVEIPLVAILRGEQLAGRHGVEPDRRLVAVRRALLVVTVLLNTWPHLPALVGRADTTLGTLLVHLVPPLVIAAAAEALTSLRAMLTDAVDAAYRSAREQRPTGRRRRTTTSDTKSEQRRRDDDRTTDQSEQLEQPEQPDEQPTPPAGSPVVGVRQRGIAWVLHRRDRIDQLEPRDIRAGMHADYGMTVSNGESSKILAAARQQLAENREASA